MYGPDCELTDRIPLPFGGVTEEEGEVPCRNLCGMAVNGERAVFLAADTGSNLSYSLCVLNLSTKEASELMPLELPQGYMELLAVQGDVVLFSLQSIPMHFTVNKGDASHWWHLYQVMPDGQTAFLEDLGQQLIWHDAQEDGSVLLLLRDTEKDTYSFRTYQY